MEIQFYSAWILKFGALQHYKKALELNPTRPGCAIGFGPYVNSVSSPGTLDFFKCLFWSAQVAVAEWNRCSPKRAGRTGFMCYIIAFSRFLLKLHHIESPQNL